MIADEWDRGFGYGTVNREAPPGVTVRVISSG